MDAKAKVSRTVSGAVSRAVSRADGGQNMVQDVVPSTDQAATLNSELAEVVPPNRLMIIGVPVLAGLILLAIFAVLLRGGDFRPPNSC